MKCVKCTAIAIYKSPSLCKNHFIKHIESTVDKTLSQQKLVHKKDHIVVGVSGGKDSISLLYILKKLQPKYGYKLTALAIDEGIANYRDKTLETVKNICTKYDIPLHIASFKHHFGNSLDVFLQTTHKSQKPCTVCGAFRRTLLNKVSRELHATKLATGHNLDDESQAILMNLFRATPEQSARLGPITGIMEDDLFIPRIKPLYFLPEKQISAYAFLMNFGIIFTECPNTPLSYRGVVGDLLNAYEQNHHGAKNNIIHHFLTKKKQLMQNAKKQISAINYCIHCNEPTASTVCKTCLLLNLMGR